MKVKEKALVVSSEQLTEDIRSLTLKVSFASEVRAGQFVNLFRSDESRLLPRPISICSVDAKAGQIRLVYRIAGSGTLEFSGLYAGDSISVMGPLGNGFPIEETAGKRVLLVGGGIGIPPMLSCAEAIAGRSASGERAAYSCAGLSHG